MRCLFGYGMFVFVLSMLLFELMSIFHQYSILMLFVTSECGSVSMPMKGRPHATAATATEPVPMKGSTTMLGTTSSCEQGIELCTALFSSLNDIGYENDYTVTYCMTTYTRSKEQ